MTNTINNVPRELLERICTMDFMGLDIDNEVAEIRKFLSCASPVPIKELSASAKVKEYEDVDGDTQHSIHFTKQKMPHGTELVRLSDAQAIIDGLRGELQQSYQQVNSECMDWAKEYERRKAVQAERDTLKSMLREFAVGISKREMPTEQELNSWFDRIDAALSAGKEGE